MPTLWRIWTAVGADAYEFIGEATGDSFAAACASFAERNPAFAKDFDPHALRYQGFALVPLERRIDGQAVQFRGDQPG
ncbi:hypothetical protein SLNSH_09260 [Alsobacter soli]|uniref:Uncharacterized protein n=1 Tax=Alsobacter soli TaxID=2109933 RepID=A0A2T1HUN5_9HYPH|nr:hypothetical protein [Alsobacter soli]PSC05375.1 hypothetical protein SLNSH_09260 [Alsobacter soli]